jgi:hypothetical protein
VKRVIVVALALAACVLDDSDHCPADPCELIEIDEESALDEYTGDGIAAFVCMAEQIDEPGKCRTFECQGVPIRVCRP